MTRRRYGPPCGTFYGHKSGTIKYNKRGPPCLFCPYHGGDATTLLYFPNYDANFAPVFFFFGVIQPWRAPPLCRLATDSGGNRESIMPLRSPNRLAVSVFGLAVILALRGRTGSRPRTLLNAGNRSTFII